MKNNQQLTAAFVCAIMATVSAAATPEVTAVDMSQSGSSREVTITYSLQNYPAVVTLDIVTNNTASGQWESIGGEHIWNATGDVWRKVDKATGVIKWHPDLSWPDHKTADNGAKAVVTAWAIDNTPDYMVVDISAGAQPGTQRYYPSVEFLPGSEYGQNGAVTNNSAYKTSMLLMRKIMAKDIRWTMGSTTAEAYLISNNQARGVDEDTHLVELTNNYYIGVFEFTQAQWALIRPGNYPSWFTVDRDWRPVERVTYNNLRMAANGSNTADGGAQDWPNPPFSGSFLDQLRSRTGIDFDLPSEAQWEFACRAGHGSGFWNDGSRVLNKYDDENAFRLGRFGGNGGMRWKTAPWDYVPLTQDLPLTNGTAIVGSYIPNSWGLYDMHGNVREWCLDWYAADISPLNGAVNTVAAANRVGRGGCCGDLGAVTYRSTAACRSAARKALSPSGTWEYNMLGFRVVCRAGLK